MSTGLDTALTRFQTRTGLKTDGYAAPKGPTVQQIAAEAEAGVTKGFAQRAPGEAAPGSDQPAPDLPPSDPMESEPETWEKPPSESAACEQAKVDFVNFSANLEAARDQLQEEQKRLENVEQALREVSQGRSRGLAEKVFDRLIAAILRRLGLAGLIVYVIIKGERVIDRISTTNNLRSRRQSLKNEIEIQKEEVQERLEKVEEARDRKLTHCGRNVLPEGPDKISRRSASATSEA
jgi:hypothetical protein